MFLQDLFDEAKVHLADNDSYDSIVEELDSLFQKIRSDSLLTTALSITDDPMRLMAGKPRSGKWPTVRKNHLAAFPTCACCGRNETGHMNVHHVKPYHLFPDLELEEINLITLCEHPALNCHLLFGHLLDWSAWNPDVRKDTAAWLAKITDRQYA